MGHLIIPGIVEPLTAPSSLPPVGTALNVLTWEQVRAISDAGLAADYFSIGDVKTIVINGKVGATTFSNLSIDAFVLGINHNSAKEGANRIHFAIGKISGKLVGLCDSNLNSGGFAGNFIMNTSDTNSGGWAGCHMRKTILGSDSTAANPTANTLLAALPADLRAAMKAISKYTNNVGPDSYSASHVTATTDYLWLLAAFEVYGSRSGAINNYEQESQAQYDYFKAGNKKIAYKYNATSTAAFWWLRSPASSSAYGFCSVSYDGSSHSASYSTTSGAVMAAFAI